MSVSSFLAVLLLAGPAWSAERYVELSGADSGNECLDALLPCGTIDRAVQMANTEDTIVLGAGTYTSSGYSIPWNLPNGVTLSGAGSALTRVHATEGTAIFSFASNNLPSTVRGVELQNSRGHAIRVTQYSDTVSQHITLDDVVLSGNSGFGVNAGTSSSGLNMGNLTLDVRNSVLSDNGWGGIALGWSAGTVQTTITNSTTFSTTNSTTFSTLT